MPPPKQGHQSTLKGAAPSADDAFRLGRRPELNGLRGLAITAVMLFHADETFLNAGFIGVDWFFVVSGFLITALLVEEYERAKRINLKHFYMRRVLRLAPALLLMLGVYAVASSFLFGFPKTYDYWVDGLIVLLYSTNWARAFLIHPPYHLGHGWSLSIEEQFYALWPPILYFMLRKIGTRWIVAVLTAGLALAALGWRNYLFLAGSTDMRIYNGLDTRADSGGWKRDGVSRKAGSRPGGKMFLESPPQRCLHIPAHPEQLIPFHRERKGLGGIGLPTA